MALEKKGKREIQLREGRESGIYGVGNQSIEAEAGKALTVERFLARLAVNSGYFEYTPKQSAEIAPTREDLLKKKKGDLVKMAQEQGASGYISRLTVPQLVDFILSPVEREKVFAEQPDTQEVKIEDDSAGGNE